MNDLISAPSLRLRVFAILAKWALRVLAMAWLAVGLLWCGLHFVIVPRIADFRPWVETQATQALGLQVRIGELQARSNGVIPSIELLRVTVFDREGREALLLPSVSAALSPRSILGLGFEQLHVDSPQLDIRRTLDGKWWIAGLEMVTSPAEEGAGADWLFSQAEVALVNGSVTWTDETRSVEPVTFQRVNLVVRNRLRTHSMRLDADPPEHWGARLSVQGVFRQPLLSRHAGQWTEWDGQAYADFSRVDLAELGRYVDLGVQLARGSGVFRAWVDVVRGTPTGAVADVSLSHVNVTTGPSLEPLALASVSGRLGARALDGGSEFSTESLQFVTQDGLHWPGGNVRLQLFAPSNKVPEHGTLTADRLDLAALAQIAGRLPLEPQAHALLQRLDPKGVVDGLEASWQGPVEAPHTYKAKGKVSQLSLPSCHCEVDSRPGVQGLDAEFDMDQTGGKATLALRRGMVDAYGVFEDPVVFFDQLTGDLQWKVDGPRLVVNGSNVRFSNADGQGELKFSWQSAVAGNGMAGPGSLDLQGTLARADGARVHRYLPLAMEKNSLEYLRASLLGGVASNVQFKVKGDLAKFPYRTGQSGEFRIAASVQNGSFAFAPAFVLPKDSLPWPVLNQLQGEMVLDRDVLQVKINRGVVGATGLQIGKAEAQVTRLYDASQVSVTAEAKGPLPDLLTVVNTSPLGPLMDKALAQTTATGVADYKLKLGFPVSDVNKVTVQGSIVLGGNDLQIIPDTPKFSRARGTINFTESGFSLAGAQARALGGDIRVEGGLSFVVAPATTVAARAAPNQLRFSGAATAEGLRQSRELGAAGRLAQFATGSAPYTASLGFRSGVPELQINSTLAGMGLNLPAPLGKTAEMALPVRFESALIRPLAGGLPNNRLRDRLQLEVGKLASFTFVRDLSGVEPRVLSGAIGVGLAADESAPLPEEGVVANMNIPRLDADAWSAVLDTLSMDVPASAGAKPAAIGGLATSGYMPTVLVLRAKELLVSGRQINNVVVGGGREGPLWRANLDATELSGYMEYRQPSGANAGRLYARLARLSIGQSSAQDVESLLDEQPSAIPALDIEVNDFVLRGKKLGRIDIEAVNLGSANTREWRLNRFNIQTPEAQLTASGNWASINASAAPVGKSVRERRRTVLNFKLDINDSGELLTRLGMPGVVRKGNGKVEGQVAWAGSPITVDYPSMSGKFNVNVETGQFLKAEPGIAKLLGVLSLQSLPRRLTLDFRDVFSEGFAFDYFRGDIAVEQGIAKTSNLQMKGVNAAVLMDGQADIAKETQNLRVVVVPEINAGSASLIASAINPVVGLSTFLAQLLLRGPLVNAATQEFVVDGTWLDPKVTQVPRKP
ncbi:hypothetical protein AEP_02801 [Curvibacter sp. AEP1-3]|uniref:YhdP family protein n=1 Tax=Curvibacter sp. AEP1-3 TaxID=1844971 RepID=UPI000B3C79FC|nr:YhdP family protein [Curvibacter sp. AEP1-3]ARV19727.1 hypothetical protein AEP_02801 [Curvibacter sp. AEP1-3]